MPAPPIADNVVHWQHGCTDDGNPCSFGWWTRIEAADSLSTDQFHEMIYNWYVFTMPTFLDCMAGSASFTTCRLTRGGSVPFVYSEQLAPNHGSQPEGQPMSTTVGLYLAPQLSYRGGGTRMHLPGLPQRFVDVNSKLSGYGVQQLTFAATALGDLMTRLTTALGLAVELITPSTRRGGVYLPTFSYEPVVRITPTLRLETIGRRMRASGGFSSP